uniref:Uncharacterized protein n=2 Tax=Oryza sativa TaxID=4530 RepID=Q5WMW9_ORYSJ|nr:hypothetical protein [Oryza sativa Japonica Group]
MAAWIEAKTVVMALLAFQTGGDRGGSGISADGALRIGRPASRRSWMRRLYWLGLAERGGTLVAAVMGRAKGGRWQTAKAFIAAASRCRSCNGFGTKGGGMVAKGNRDSSSVPAGVGGNSETGGSRRSAVVRSSGGFKPAVVPVLLVAAPLPHREEDRGV